ncbi:MAG TPA: hypothetical protein VF182_25595 [Candidatus Binatia bacterium]
MRLFLRKVLLFMLVQCLIWTGVVALYIRSEATKGDGFAKGYLGATIDKHNRLAQQPSPRIVFVGGSNLAFGLDSAAVERSLGYHPVNMGLDISLGLDFMLREIEPFLARGDVVVISPEYEEFIDMYPGKSITLFPEATIYPRAMRFFSYRHFTLLLDEGLILIGEITRAAVRFLTVGVSNEVRSDNPYVRSAFNEYGDITRHHNLKSRHISIRQFGPSSPESITRVIDRLNQFNDHCRSDGISVFYSYPPIFSGQLEAYTEMIHDIASNLTRRLHFPILNTPDDMSFPANYMFDHEYHLTLSGKQIRTNQLITTLRKKLTAPENTLDLTEPGILSAH